MRRLGTWNVNGLRSAVKNGLLDVLEEHRLDVVLLQELRCDTEKAFELLAPLLGSFSLTVAASTNAGSSGVAILGSSVLTPVRVDLGHDALQAEGRVVGARVGDLEVWSCYAPSGASKKDRLALKHDYLRRLLEIARRRGADQATVVGGDLNVAHTPRDVEGPEPRRPGPGYLPLERAMLDELIGAGWVDLVRSGAGVSEGPFTWRSRSRGWRLDHLWGSPALKAATSRVSVESGRPISDHRLLVVGLD